MTANPHIDRLRKAVRHHWDGNAALDALAADLDAANTELQANSKLIQNLELERDAAIRERDEARVTLRIEMDMGERWRKQSLAAEARVAELERERDAWASSHAERDKLLWAADARVAELETALRDIVKLQPSAQYAGANAVSIARAALAAEPADTEGSGRG